MRQSKRLQVGQAVALVCFLAAVVTARSQAMASTSQPATPAAARPTVLTCAVLPDPSLSPQQAALSAVLEQQLAGQNGLRLVEREQIGKILREQELAVALAPEGTASRVHLGKLLQADLLVFLRIRRSETESKEQVLELSVAETRQGLRLVMDWIPWSDSRVEEGSRQFAEDVMGAVRLVSAGDLKVFTVPPFVSGDVGRRHEQKRFGYALLAEQLLTRRAGVAVVELAEARAMARELAIGGTKIERDLPYYINGSYKTHGDRQEVTISFGLELRRGEESLGEVKREAVPLSQVPEEMDRGLDELFAKIGDSRPAPPDLAREAAQLVNRAGAFRRIGDWDAALPLYESALLCQADDRDALLGLIDGYSLLALRGGFGPLTVRGLRYSPRGRMEAAESVAAYLALLLTKYPVSTRALGSMSSFVRDFHLRDYDVETDWDDAVPLYRQTSRSLYDILMAVIEDPGRFHRPDGMTVKTLAAWASLMAWEYAAIDPQETVARIRRLLTVIDKHIAKKTITCAELETLMPDIGQIAVAREPYFALLDEFASSESPRLKFTARVARLLQGVKDAESQRKAVEEIDTLMGTDVVLTAVKSMIPGYCRRQLGRTLPTQPAAAEGEVEAPRLTSLGETADVVDRRGARRGGMYYIHNWLNVRPDLELVATDGVIYRVSPAGRFEEFFGAGALQLHWDGKYLWAPHWKRISMLDETGREFVRYNESEVTAMISADRFRYAPVAPGQLCMLGLVDLAPSGVRTWAGILRWDAMSDGRLAKRVEPFFEARLQRTPVVKDAVVLDTAFTPAWGIDLPHGGPDGEPLFILKHVTTRPLVIDPTHKTARLAKQPWPLGGVVVRDGDTVYLSPGQRDTTMDGAVYAVKHPDEPPQVVAELSFSSLGQKPLQYTSMAVFEGKIHLLAYLHGDADSLVFAWIVVDPATKQSFVLADPLPPAVSVWPKLKVSNHFGLVIVAGGVGYVAALPPEGRWKPLSSRTLTHALSRPAPLPEKLKDPFWGLNAPDGEEAKVLRGHKWDVTSVSFSPDGRRAVSGGGFIDRTVVVWDLQAGRQQRVLKGQKGGSFAVAYSPDGRYVVSGGFEKTPQSVLSELLLWDAEEGRLVRSFLSTTESIPSLAFSSDGSRLLAGSSRGVLRMFDVTSGEAVYTIPCTAGIWAAVFSHDGSLMATGWGDEGEFAIRLADPKTGREVRRISRLSSCVRSLAFSPKDDLLLAAAEDGSVRLYDVKSGRRVKQFIGDPGGARSVAFLPDGRYFIGGGGGTDSTIARRYRGASPSKASGNPENDLLLWSIDRSTELMRFKGHVQAIRGVAVSSDGRYAISASEDHTVRLWTLPGSAELTNLDRRAAEKSPEAADTALGEIGRSVSSSLTWRVAAIVLLVGVLGLLTLMRRRGGTTR